MKYIITLIVLFQSITMSAQLDYNTGLLEIDGEVIDVDKIVSIMPIWDYNIKSGITVLGTGNPFSSGLYFNIQFESLPVLIRYKGKEKRDIILKSWANWKKHKNYPEN